MLMTVCCAVCRVESMKVEEASDTGGEDPQEEDPPPEITNLNDYNVIFKTRRERESPALMGRGGRGGFQHK